MELQGRKVKELVLEIPGATSTFEKLGIDYCCGGDQTLEQACLSAGLDPDQVAARLQTSGDAKREEGETAPDWRMQPLSRLISHIVDKHHSFVRHEVPRLEALAAKVCSAHADRHPELGRIGQLLSNLGEELLQHLQKEEHILFPYVTRMEDALQKNQHVLPPPFATVQNPVQVMAAEHDHAGQALRVIRAASSNYSVPADGCAGYRSFYEGLRAFEQDLHMHIHLENNILFPRAVALEEKAFSHS